jgi:hypothetical protein
VMQYACQNYITNKTIGEGSEGLIPRKRCIITTSPLHMAHFNFDCLAHDKHEKRPNTNSGFK